MIDAMDRRILVALEENARIAFTDLGRKVGLSSAAVAERVRRLEETGVIIGYRAVVNPEKIGFPVSAYVKVKVRQEDVGKLIALARSTPEVKEAHHSTQAEVFLLRIASLGETELASVIAQLSELGETESTIVDSTPVEKYTT